MSLALARVALLAALAARPAGSRAPPVRDDRGPPFPTNLLTVSRPDPAHGPARRPAAARLRARPSDCADVAVLNTLDGFNVQPRLSIPFSGPIDVSTVSSDTVFLADSSRRAAGSGSTRSSGSRPRTRCTPSRTSCSRQGTTLRARRHRRRPGRGRRAELDGERASATTSTSARRRTRPSKATARSLLDALHWSGVDRGESWTRASSRPRASPRSPRRSARQIDAATPAPADFTIGSHGERAVFPISTRRRRILVTRQTGHGADLHDLAPLPVAVPVVPGAVGTVAFGRYRSPDYETAGEGHPAVPARRPGRRCRRRRTTSTSTLYLPAGPSPPAAGRWRSSATASPTRSRARRWPSPPSLAQHGLATIAINAVGHGGGPLGTLTVLPHRRRRR